MKKSTLLTVTGLALVLVLAVGPTTAQNRERKAGSGDPRGAGVGLKSGGPDCATATEIPPSVGDPDVFDYTDSDNSCGGNSAVSDYFSASCATVDPGYPGPELIYTFSVGNPPNSANITLTPSAADMAVFLVSDCTDTTSCLVFEDQIGGGAVSTVTANDLAAGQYWIYVDSYYAAGAISCGDYTLRVTGQVPVKLLDFEIE